MDSLAFKTHAEAEIEKFYSPDPQGDRFSEDASVVKDRALTKLLPKQTVHSDVSVLRKIGRLWLVAVVIVEYSYLLDQC